MEEPHPLPIRDSQLHIIPDAAGGTISQELTYCIRQPI